VRHGLHVFGAQIFEQQVDTEGIPVGLLLVEV